MSFSLFVLKQSQKRNSMCWSCRSVVCFGHVSLYCHSKVCSISFDFWLPFQDLGFCFSCYLGLFLCFWCLLLFVVFRTSTFVCLRSFFVFFGKVASLLNSCTLYSHHVAGLAIISLCNPVVGKQLLFTKMYIIISYQTTSLPPRFISTGNRKKIYDQFQCWNRDKFVILKRDL